MFMKSYSSVTLQLDQAAEVLLELKNKFVPANVFKIGHPPKFMSTKFFKLGHLRNFIFAKFKTWPYAKVYDRQVLNHFE